MNDDILTGAGVARAVPGAVHRITTGRDFGTSLCRHLGLNPNHVAADIKLTAGVDEIFGVWLHVALSAKDAAAIAEGMT